MSITIKSGSNNSDVLKAKQILNFIGYMLTENTIFDNAMSSAVKDFQQRAGLVADGIVGSKTWAKLNEVAAAPVTLVKPITISSSASKSPSVPIAKSGYAIVSNGSTTGTTAGSVNFNWKTIGYVVAMAIGFLLIFGSNDK
jgi:peptidoglycan hydrolase-like protein with peptidoglycan-binding domain